jgi:hypothetical protein
MGAVGLKNPFGHAFPPRSTLVISGKVGRRRQYLPWSYSVLTIKEMEGINNHRIVNLANTQLPKLVTSSLVKVARKYLMVVITAD